MSRPIDADALKNIHGMRDDCAECDKELRHKSRSCEFDRVYTLMDFCGWIDDAPTIEPERKTGKWQITESYPHNVYCSECHTRFAQTRWAVWEDGSLPRRYCPNCGARMEGGE